MSLVPCFIMYSEVVYLVREVKTCVMDQPSQRLAKITMYHIAIGLF